MLNSSIGKSVFPEGQVFGYNWGLFKTPFGVSASMLISKSPAFEFNVIARVHRRRS